MVCARQGQSNRSSSSPNLNCGTTYLQMATIFYAIKLNDVHYTEYIFNPVECRCKDNSGTANVFVIVQNSFKCVVTNYRIDRQHCPVFNFTWFSAATSSTVINKKCVYNLDICSALHFHLHPRLQLIMHIKFQYCST